MKNLISHHNMNLKKGTLLFLLLTCLAYTTLAQTDHTLQYEDITIDGNGIITACTYDFEANEDAGGTKLIIPKSVTKPIDGGGVETIIIKGIANESPGVFQNKNLVSLTFVDSEVETIGSYAFWNNSITELSLPASLTTIGNNAFYNNKITTLSLPPSLETIGKWAFYNNQITTLTIPNNSQLMTIGDNAFQGNDGDAAGGNKITTLSLPPSLETIGKWAFYNNSLTTVTFNVDLSKSKILEIGSGAFSGNTGLTGITLPKHAEETDEHNVTYKDSNNQEYDPNDEDNNSFTHFDRSLVTVLPYYELTSNDVTVDEQGIITGCTCNFISNRIIIPVKIPTRIETTTIIYTIHGIGSKAFFGKNLVAVTFQKGSQVTSIGHTAFSYNQITTLSLPPSLTTIGLGAFFHNQITTLSLPPSLETIAREAFYNNQITTLSLPPSLETIGKWAFYNNQITTLTIPNDSKLKTIGYNAFQGNEDKYAGGNKITTLSLPPSLETIGGEAFSNNSLTTVTFNVDLSKSKILEIGSGAFSGNTGLTGITLPEHAEETNVTYKDSEDDVYSSEETFSHFDRRLVTVFPYYTLKEGDVKVVGGIITECYCNFGSNRIIIPVQIGTETITGIKSFAFKSKNLAAVIFAKSSKVISIGYEAFEGNIIETLVLPTVLTTIEHKAFLNNKITELSLPPSLTTIGDNAFEGNNIPTLSIPNDSKLKTIGKWTFYNNEITELSLPPSLTTIGKKAFYDNSLISVTFNDDPEKSQIREIGSGAFSGNNVLTGIKLPKHAEGTGVTYIDSRYQKYDPEKSEHMSLFDIALVMVLPPHKLTSSDVTVDEQGIITGCNCENFVSNSIIIPVQIGTKTITGIGDNVFQSKNLASVTFETGSKVISIGESAFSDGKGDFYDNLLYSFTLPMTVIDGVRTYWKDSNEKNKEGELTIFQVDFVKSFELVSIQQVTLTLTIKETEASGEVSGLSAGDNKIDKGADFELEAIPASGQRFASWTIGGKIIENNPYTLTTTETDISITVTFEAIPLDEQVTLTLAIVGEGSTTPDEADTIYEKGKDVKLTATPDEGWRFDRWVMIEQEDILTNTHTITLQDNIQATAHFIKQVTLIPAIEGKGGITRSVKSNVGMYDINTEVKFTASPADGWRFDKWVIGGEDENDNPTIVKFDVDKTVTAHFVQLVTLTTAVEGEQRGTITRSVEPNDKGVYDINTEVTLTAEPKQGWKFDKWVIEGEDENDNPITVTVDAVRTATAHFVEAVTLTLTIVETEASGEVSGLSAGENKIDKGADFKLEAIPVSGQRFASWTIGGQTIVDNPYTLTATQADISITVTFEAIPLGEQVTLTLAIVGEGSTTPDEADTIYEKGKDVDLIAEPNPGWRFDKWVIERENENDKTTTITLDTDKSVTAHFVELVTLTLTIEETEASGEVSGLSAGNNKIDKGADFKLQAMPASGQRFVSWNIGGKTIKNNPHTLPTTAIATDISITVTFEAIQVMLTLAIEGEGSITQSLEPNSVDPDNEMKGMYDINTEVTLTATPQDGWRFDKWVISDEENETDKVTTITMATDKSVTAHFVEIVTLTVEVNDKEGGSIEPPDGNFVIDKAEAPSTQELTAKPNDGWRFDKWIITSGEDGNGNPITKTVHVVGVEVTVDADKTATAYFVKLVTLTTSVEGQQGGTISATPNHSLEDNQYDINTDVKLTATPNEGWRFDKWVISDEQDKTDETTTITLDADKTATAHFVQQFTLTLTIEETEASGEVSGVSAGENKIDKGADFKLKAMPASGQKFVSWTIDGKTITNEEYTLPATDTKTDISITVTFKAIEQVTLTLDIVGEGSTTPDKGENIYKKDKDVELTATPNDGWRFERWIIESDEITENPTTITLDKNKSVTAYFVEEEEAITGILTEVVSATPYPNPVTSQITLKAKDSDLIQLFSQKGEQQYSAQHTGNEVHTIDVSTLPVGVYLVRITDAKGNTTTKRILKK